MSSNMFSGLGRSTAVGRSFYEELRARDDDQDRDDALRLDEENLRHHFTDEEAAVGIGVSDSRITILSGPIGGHVRPLAVSPSRAEARRKLPNLDDDFDNDVPTSLLIEPNDRNRKERHEQASDPLETSSGVAGPSTKQTREMWNAATTQQPVHSGHNPSGVLRDRPRSVLKSIKTSNARDKAMWRWVNVTNLDSFVRDVYNYYEGGGLWVIQSSNALQLLKTLFVAVLLTFLCQCVDYSKLPHSKSLDQVVVPQCTRNMSTLWNIGIWFYSFYFIWKSVQYFFEMRRLLHIREFFVHLLEIPDQDMQTISWQDVVARLMSLRDHNPKTAANVPSRLRNFLGSQSKERLDAHDIANRLMRQDNYLIALINKDVLDLSLPIPFLRGRQLLSTTMIWYLQYCILDMAFNELGQVTQDFLRADRRGVLSQKLRQRFIFAGFLNLMFAPFVFAYVVVVYFFTYYNEYQKDPKLAAARKYTALAEWKFREFNEVQHMFYERLHMSYPFATRYLDQFPKRVTEEVARSIAFMTGAITAVLAVLTVLDSELFLGFEITKDRTVLFYLGVFGAIWAMTRGIVSEETLVFNPEYAMRNVIEYTHYMPKHWEDRLHSSEVKQEFSELYKMKVVILLEEILGIITTPMLLLFALPKCSDQIVDFFREFTIHVDGLGYVCSFAVFDFKKGIGDTAQHGPGHDVREDYYSTKHGKMAASYYGFIDNYVINPKTGIPGHQPPSARQQPFHPPPVFAGLNSPSLMGDLQASGRAETGRSRSRVVGAGTAAGTVPGRSLRGTKGAFAQPSPMASMLLDPHHQPPSASLVRSLHQSRHPRGLYRGEEQIIEEMFEDGDRSQQRAEDDMQEGGTILDESTWETSPGKGLSRENSAANTGEPEAGVLGMIYQFQQTQRNRRGGNMI